jgi:hypothetical protein
VAEGARVASQASVTAPCRGESEHRKVSDDKAGRRPKIRTSGLRAWRRKDAARHSAYFMCSRDRGDEFIAAMPVGSDGSLMVRRVSRTAFTRPRGR